VTAGNWGFVVAAYGLAAVVLIAYWRFLVRREKELQGQGSGVSEPQASVSGHPRSEPASRSPLP